MTKSEVRQEIRRRKAACSAEERAVLSRQVTAKLVATPQWQHAHTVLLYHSLPDEVATHQLITEALSAGKRVLLPVVVGDDLELRFLPTPDALREGAFHILEPTGAPFTDYAAIDLAVIPGVAFTPDGRRLGRGRGYYDRLLAHFPQSLSSSLSSSLSPSLKAKRVLRGLPLGHPCPMRGGITPMPTGLRRPGGEPSPYLIGLCWPFQLLADLPTEPHDLTVHAVIA